MAFLFSPFTIGKDMFRKNWEKEKIYMSDAEAADRDFLQDKTDAAGHSEVLRRALRILEELVEGERSPRQEKLYIQKNGDKSLLSSEMFKDAAVPPSTLTPTSIFLSPDSKARVVKMKDELGAADISEVMRIALRLFFRIAKEADSGARFFVSDVKGGFTEVGFEGLPQSAHAERNASPDGDAARATLVRPQAPPDLRK
ncbi:MAG: hypothetical protein P4M15_01495 [Alphaproteobacteria bacterium]|nr:hypothetical protein [Alphaproteobacteria bacterium]